MNIALVTSNSVPVDKGTAKGTELFVWLLLQNLKRYSQHPEINYSLYAAGDSDSPYPLHSLRPDSTSKNPAIGHAGKQVMFELALLSKAFQDQESIDAYHIHIGDGDLVMPFIPFIKKPVIVTLHHLINEAFTREYFSYFQHLPNLSFISISDAQRRILPDVPYRKTIHHGIEIDTYEFSPGGGEYIMWAGRAVPDKGIDVIADIGAVVGNKIILFAIQKEEHKEWFDKILETKILPSETMQIFFNTVRYDLIHHFQQSKVFLFPIQYEESFGLVVAESMACGTPVIAYARGAMPEIIEDGRTGFLVNPSDQDKRGDFIVRETGMAGLLKAIEMIYSLDSDSYRAMRLAARKRAEDHFSVERMIHDYESVYTEVRSG